MKSKTIKVNYLARVEGEASLLLRIHGKEVKECRLSIFEPPRFFEAFLKGRRFDEAPDITSRICGICPVAYLMSSCQAMENALDITIPKDIRLLRRLLYCGEWMESHSLHITMLHTPDFLGFENAIDMAKKHPQWVQRGLYLKKVGNELMTLLGGREIHPINVRVGGFYRVPDKNELKPISENLKKAREAALETVHWVANFDFPDYDQDYEFVSLIHDAEYPMNEGRIASNKGLDIMTKNFDDVFEEVQVPYSNALHCFIKDRSNYLCGPMARFNLNYERLSPLVRQTAQEAGIAGTCRNPFQSIIVRALEVLYACDEALRLIDNYEKPGEAFVKAKPHEAIGFGCTEAPRGLLYHRYRIDKEGLIQDAKIVPPTSQNQKTIEEDLKGIATQFLNLPQDELQHRCEQSIRNFDPCISCATHFLKVKMEQTIL